MNKLGNYNLDKFIRHLSTPLANDRSAGCCKRIIHKIGQVARAILNFFALLWNCFFGDHRWYSAKNARRVLVHYMLPENIYLLRDGTQINQLRQIHQKLGSPHKMDGVNIFFDSKQFSLNILDSFNSRTEVGQTDYNFVPLQNFSKSVPVSKLERLVFHINGGRIGADTKLEGLDEACSFASQYLREHLAKRVKTDPALNRICTLLDKASQVAEKRSPTSIKEAIEEAFAKQEPLLLRSGWIGQPGHAIYIELIPNSRDTATVREYNLGSGAAYEEQHLAKDGCNKAIPTYKSREYARTSLATLEFATAFYEIRHYLNDPAHSEKTNYSAIDLKALMDICEPLDPNYRFSSTLMLPQDTGICAWQSLLAFIRTRWIEWNPLSGEKNYKRFKLDIRLDSFLWVQATSWNTESTIRLNTIMSAAVSKVARAVNKMQKKQIVSSKYVEDMNTITPLMECWINDNNRTATELISIPKVNPAHPFTMPNLASPLLHKISRMQTAPVTSTSMVSSLEKMQKISSCLSMISISSLKTSMESMLKLALDAWENKEYFELHHGLLHFAKAINLEALDKLTPDTKTSQHFIVEFGKLGELFFKSCFLVPNAHIQQPITLYGAWKYLAIANGFFRQINGSGLNTNLPGLVLPFFLLQDADCQKELFQYQNRKKDSAVELYAFHRSHDSGISTHMDNETLKWSPLVRKYVPDLTARMQSEHPTFSSLSLGHQEALIWVTNRSQPDWLISLRDSWLRGSAITELSIARPSNFDPRKSLQWGPPNITSFNENTFVTHNLTDVTEQLLKDYPILDEIKSDPMLRFYHAFGKFSSPGMHKLCPVAIQKKHANEKQLIVNRFSGPDFGLTEEVYQEICHLFLAQNTRHAEWLEYVEKYLQNILERDTQIIFQMLFYNLNILQPLVNSPNGEHVAKLYKVWMDKQMEFHLTSSNIQVVIFLIQLNKRLAKFFPTVFSFEVGLTSLKKIIKTVPDLEYQSLIYGELMSHLGIKSTLDDDEAAAILVGKALLVNQPIPSKWLDPMQQPQPEETLHLHRFQLAVFLEKERQRLFPFMTTLCKHLQLPTGINWSLTKTDGGFPKLRGELNGVNYQYTPLEGKLIVSNGIEVLLSEKIYDHPHFVSLFPHIKFGKHIGNDVYQFFDSKKRKTLVKLDAHDNPIIDQEWQINNNKVWVRHQPKQLFVHKKEKEIVSSFCSWHFVTQYDHWISPGTKQLYLENEKGEIVFKAKCITTAGKISIDALERVSDSYLVSKNALSSSQLDDPSEEIFLSSPKDGQGVVSEIWLPRLNLKFILKNGSYYSTQFEDFYLTQKRLPQLGAYTRYAVLRNASGDEMLILPCFDFDEPDDKNDVLLCNPRINFKLSSIKEESIPFFSYTIDTKGQIKAPSREAELRLAYTLIGLANSATEFPLHRYRTAAKYLREIGKRPGQYMPKERALLLQILDLQNKILDRHADAIGLRLYAGYLLLNDIDRIRNEPSTTMELIESEYAAYLAKRNNATALILSEEEELFLLHHLLAIPRLAPKTFQQFYQRLVTISPSHDGLYKLSAKENDRPYVNASASLSYFNSVIPSYLAEQWKKAHSTAVAFPSKVLLSRIDLAFKSYFIPFYLIAINGSLIETEKLTFALRFTIARNQPITRSIAECFLIIFQNRTLFPQIPISTTESLENYQSHYAWQAKVMKILTSNYKPIGEAERKSISSYPLRELIQPTIIPTPSLLPEEIAKTLSWTPSCNPAHLQLDTLALKLTPKQEIEKKESQDAASTPSLMKMLLEPLVAKHIAGTPLYEAEYARLLKDEIAHRENCKKQSKPLEATISPKQQEEARVELTKRQNSSSESAERLKTQIIKKINTIPDTNPLLMLRLNEGSWQKWDWEMILANFAKQDPEQLHQHSPFLTDAEIKQLYTNISDFLLFNTHTQQCTRSLKALDLYVSEPSQLKLEHFFEMLKAKRVDYSLHDRAALLVFENYAEILLRKEQVEKIEKFLKIGDWSMIDEMIMGSGKSKVLLPLLAYLRANGKQLSTLILPKSLFASIAQDTQKSVNGAFQQPVVPFSFERNSPCSFHDLVKLKEKLLTAEREKRVVMMTNTSFISLIVKFLELSNALNLGADVKDRLTCMQQIINQIRKHSFPLIDEGDTILNVLRSNVCYSIGSPMAPDAAEVNVIIQLFTLIYTHPDLNNIANLNSNPAPKSALPTLTDDLYDKRYKTVLAQQFIQQQKELAEQELKSSTELTSALQQSSLVASFFRNLKVPSKDYNLVLAYLCHDESQLDAAQKYYDEQPSIDVQTVLATASQMISELLKFSLTREINKDHGLEVSSKLTPLAVPFMAANIPVPNSQFASNYLTIALTTQLYCYFGISEKVLELSWKNLQNQARLEMDKDRSLSINKTKAAQLFLKLCGDEKEIPFLNYKPAHFDRLLKKINKNIPNKLDFVQHLVIPQLEIYRENLSFNPHNLIGFFPKEKVTAFTGTLAWMAGSLHHHFSPTFEAGNTTKIAEYLINKSREAVHIIKDGTAVEMLKATSHLNTDLFIDAGGYCKTSLDPSGNIIAATNEETANALSNITNLPTIYYTEQGVPLCTRKGNLNLPSHARRVFLDEMRTVGADYPYRSNAIGIVTIGQKMSLRDLEQACCRLRELGKGQKAVFVVSESVASVIRNTLELAKDCVIRFDEIYQFVFLNQCIKQASLNVKSLSQEVEEVVQRTPLLMLLECIVSSDKFLAIFKQLRPRWFKTNSASAREMFGTLPKQVKSNSVITKLINAAQSHVDHLFTKFPTPGDIPVSKAVLVKEINEVTTAYQHRLPANLPNQDSNLNLAFELNTETELALAKELATSHEHLKTVSTLGHGVGELKLTSDSPLKLIHAAGGNYFILGRPVFTFNHYVNYDSVLKEVGPVFHERLTVSINLLEWDKDAPSSTALYGSNRTPIHFAQITPDVAEMGKYFPGTKGILTLIGQEDSEQLSSRDRYNLRVGFASKTPIEINWELKPVLVQAWFLQGRLDYDESSKEALKKWIRTAGVEKMERLALHILSYSKRMMTEYNSSILRQVFQELYLEQASAPASAVKPTPAKASEQDSKIT